MDEVNDDMYKMDFNLYDALKISDCKCDKKTIKDAYQKLILIHHPDKQQQHQQQQEQVLSVSSTSDNTFNQSDSCDMFIKLQIAWNTLSNDSSRKRYDDYLLQLSRQTVNHYVHEARLSDFKHSIDDRMYTKQCRCGDLYEISQDDVDNGYNTIQCNSCSLELQIIIT